MSIQKNLRPDIKDLFTSGIQIYVAVSGGADSVALLHMLYQAGVNPIALHVNHMLRGEESDRDERFVAEFCQSLGVK